MHSLLFLDDSSARQRAVRSRYPYVVQAWTVAEAIHQLAWRRPWDLVCLDHDLGGEVMVSSDRADTGAEVVRHLVRQLCPIRLIAVHTYNTPAGERMVTDLRQAGYLAEYAPYGRLLFEVIDRSAAAVGMAGLRRNRG